MQIEENTFSTVSDIQRYIDIAGLSYLNGINGTTNESLVRRVNETSRLKNHLPSPRQIISVGVGQGEELHALDTLYSGSVNILGIDLSPLALQAAEERVREYNLPVELVVGSATDLPFSDRSVDGVMLSSLLHEVYSYSTDGKNSWDKAIKESVRIIDENGCIFIRDSAAPDLRGDVDITFRTDFAKEFYDYFIKEYRRFNGWSNLRSKFSIDTPEFQERNGPLLRLPVGQAAEFLFQFVNFEMGYPNDQEFLGNIYWKELNETYYIANRSHPADPMRQDEYVQEVLSQGNSILQGTELALICVENGFSVRPRMYKPLAENFFVGMSNAQDVVLKEMDEVLDSFINKMELVFKKVKI